MKYRRVFRDGFSYFITVVTYQRNPILLENIDLLRQSFRYAKSKFEFEIEAIVVLPDHFHTILLPKEAKNYPKIISSIKRYFSQRCDPKFYRGFLHSHSREKQGYKPVWQKRFFEHTLRNEKDWKIHFDYIHYNPVKHGYVDCAEDWRYSSFGKYVREGIYDAQWCDFSEKLDLE